MKFIQKQHPVVKFLIYLAFILFGGGILTVILGLVIPVPDDIPDWMFSLGYSIAIVVTVILAFAVERSSVFALKENAEAVKRDIQAVQIRTENTLFQLEGIMQLHMQHEKDIYLNAGATVVNETHKEKRGRKKTIHTLSEIRRNIAKYPELKSDDEVMRMFGKIVDFHNEIMLKKTEYNKLAAEYNISIQKFPGSTLRKSRGLELMEYYEENSDELTQAH